MWSDSNDQETRAKSGPRALLYPRRDRFDGAGALSKWVNGVSGFIYSEFFQEYFLHTHNYRMRFPDLPGIIVMKKDKGGEKTDAFDIIPFELLEIVEGQFYRRRLEPAVQKEFHRLATTEPEERKATIVQHLKATSIFTTFLYLD